jgi:leucyl aminopeptidase
VARASVSVPRHRPCVVRLELGPEDAAEPIVLCGTGVTYDTGGADLKTNGAMAGMSRDKGGAGAVAGLMRVLAEAPPKGVRVVALLGMVRNSIGEESFVSDEIIPSRAGVLVRIGNTDAEGRLVLADLLSEGAEILGKKQGIVLSVATLTGHVYRALGPYVGALGNALARDASLLPALAAHGEALGEPMEVERPRREDYALVAPKSVAEELMSSNRLASVDTPRGHQFPFAFLDLAARLSKRGVAFGHLDIGGAAMSPADWQAGRPTGSPVLALANWIAARGA